MKELKKGKYKAAVCGHFGFGRNFYDGQTVKTKIVTSELEKQFGSDCVCKVDTYGGIKRLPVIVIRYFKLFLKCKNVIILPAHNGIKLFVPLAVLFNIFFHRKLHYIVIGGWLAEYLKKNRYLIRFLKKFDGIYVETSTMKKALEEKGFRNIEVVPNCKELNILHENQIEYNNMKPYKLCTFSRVSKEKGIEIAVDAVKMANKKLGETAFSLDIYGQIDSNQIKWFEKLESSFPDFINYGGVIPFDKSTDVLKKYFALLFPTFYEGEGFAGTLIDALSAGVPVIASDWKYNSEIVKTYKTGKIIDNNLEDELIYIYKNYDEWNKMRVNCIHEATKYLPGIALRCLIDKLD